MLLKLLVGMLLMARAVGSLRTLGVKIGDKMALRNYLLYFSCVLINQEEIGLERFTLAVALHNEQI